MKILIVIATTIILAIPLLAAQCEGVTKAGERCKRDAAEGGAFCIGHKEQTPKAAKEQDNGQCWAVTEAGKRCRCKAAEGSDYCAQHSPSAKPAN